LRCQGGRAEVHQVRVVVSLGSLLFPGFGHAVISRRWTALVWSLGLVAAMWIGTWFPYALVFGALARVPCAVHSYISFGRVVPQVEAGPPAAVVAGNVAEQPPPGRNWRLAAIIALVTAVGFGLQRRFTEGFLLHESAMTPTLLAGDRVITESLTLLWRGPERGEVVVYEYPCDARQKFISRVIAIGGDSVEVRCDRIYVNGAAVPTVPQPGECSYLDGDIDYSTRETSVCSRFTETIGGHTYDVVTDVVSPDAPPRNDSVHDFPLGQLPRCKNADERPGILVTTNSSAGECEQEQHYEVPPGHVFVLADRRDDAVDSRVFGAVPNGSVLARVTYLWMSMAPDGEPRRLMTIE
jgi:signal peptidase I